MSTPSSTFHVPAGAAGAAGVAVAAGADGAPPGAAAGAFPPRPAATVQPVRSLPLNSGFHCPGDCAETDGPVPIVAAKEPRTTTPTDALTRPKIDLIVKASIVRQR